MQTDFFGNPIFEDEDIIQLMYNGNMDDLTKIITYPSFEVNKLAEETPVKIFTGDSPGQYLSDVDSINQQNWFIPEEYHEFDVYTYCLDKCTTNAEKKRVLDELKEYEDRNLIILLKVLKYLVDTMRENNVVWGVGRGSSIASYVLYLLGVHKINSFKYNMDVSEFLR